MIRIPKSKQTEASASAAAESVIEETSDEVFVGMEVEARFRGKGKWCKATVMKDHPGKGGETTYDLKYVDGKSVSKPAFGSSGLFNIYLRVSKVKYIFCNFNINL